MSDLHKLFTHRWLTPKAKAFNSNIDKIGVVATENISKGENIAVLGGVIVSVDKIKDYWSKMGHVGIQIDDNFFIVPTSREELKEKGVFNHSCNPNCGFDGSIKLVAIKNVKKGEELTFDYAFCESLIVKDSNENEFECKCGATNCRKAVKPTDWRILELQKKYGNYFSSYIKNRIS